ncbi:hypothetical protein QFZ56_002561 [Streptomyces achromogenes]|uniref:Uncharacterized protein n=1 Tax=Streptomyces achromogenes TaxID=67255 RepID=A0ABU0PYY5_STRAH|nr:hypothetical protein [Streptomyces achromogenes]MDQ0683598.1 hypothetical protein [Streptomyces achromogenes]
MNNTKRVLAALVLAGAALSATTSAHAADPDQLVSETKDDPEIIDIIKTTILFNKNIFDGPRSTIETLIPGVV